MSWRRTVLMVGATGLAALIAVQFIRPEISHPPVTADLAAPHEVKEILRNSCYDCHSNETHLAWFDQIVPAYWLVASDVKEARRHLNFSEIGKLPATQLKAALYEAVNQVQLGAMPLPAYTRLHHDAVVAPGQLTVLKNYLNPATPITAASAKDLASDDAQYGRWIHESLSTLRVAPAPNGIEFLPDYKNWKAISTTDRFDNQTLRVILGNGAAVKAIAENRMNPWPDGTAFAKVAWFARDNGQGQMGSGAFFQVEFMIRDSKKYRTTKGWGWARWRGAGLTPYGKDADFSAECVGCHTPVRDSDYVFTLPLPINGGSPAAASINRQAALTGSLPRNPLQWNVIASSVDRPSSTMSTLYGNDIAARCAQCGKQDYPAGSVLSLVSWSQREDERWFGGRIPGQVKSVEFVSITAGPGNETRYSYENYQGSPLMRVSTSEGHPPGSRADYLLSQRAAVMP
jgi:hypothetical protein